MSALWVLQRSLGTSSNTVCSFRARSSFLCRGTWVLAKGRREGDGYAARQMSGGLRLTCGLYVKTHSMLAVHTCTSWPLTSSKAVECGTHYIGVLQCWGRGIHFAKSRMSAFMAALPWMCYSAPLRRKGKSSACMLRSSGNERPRPATSELMRASSLDLADLDDS